MNKTLLALAALSTAAVAAPFNGFYVGAEAGADMFKLDIPNDAVSKASKKTYLPASLVAGYNKSFGTMFVGGEVSVGKAFGELDVNDKTTAAIAQDAIATNNPAGVIAAGSDANIKLSRGVHYGVALRAGYKIDETMAVFVKLPIQFEKTKYNASATDGANTATQPEAKLNLTTLAPAVGLEKAFGNISVNGSVGWTFSKLEGVNTFVSTGAIVKVGVSYNF